MRGDQNKKLTLRIAVAPCLAVLLISSVMAGLPTRYRVIAQSSKPTTSEAGIIEKVTRSPKVRIGFENPEGVPLVIREAKVKTITGEEYLQLMGLRVDQGLDSDEYTSFPTVTLTNNTDRRITLLSLSLMNKRSEWMPFVLLSGISINPHSDYTLEANKWVRPNDTLIEMPAGGEMAQPKMWMPGGASDLVVTGGTVRFEDGGQWPTKHGKSLGLPSSPPPPSTVEASQFSHIPRLSSGQLQSLVMKRVQPVYPVEAGRGPIEGAVAVEIVVDENGDVIFASATSGDPQLQNAAVEAARLWKFERPIISGMPTKVRGTLIFNFKR